MSERIAKSGIWPVVAPAAARVDTGAGWRVVSSYGNVEAEVAAARTGVALADVSAAAKLVIQGRNIESILTDAFAGSPAVPGDVATFESGWITKLNRYEYYAVVPLDRQDGTMEMLQRAFEGLHAHVTGLTHGRDALALAGPHAAQTLSKLSALDLHNRAFPDRRTQIGPVAGVTTLMARLDRGDVPWYELHVDRSYGRYLCEAILDAGEEFGARMIGRDAIARL